MNLSKTRALQKDGKRIRENLLISREFFSTKETFPPFFSYMLLKWNSFHEDFGKIISFSVEHEKDERENFDVKDGSRWRFGEGRQRKNIVKIRRKSIKIFSSCNIKSPKRLTLRKMYKYFSFESFFTHTKLEASADEILPIREFNVKGFSVLLIYSKPSL